MRTLMSFDCSTPDLDVVPMWQDHIPVSLTVAFITVMPHSPSLTPLPKYLYGPRVASFRPVSSDTEIFWPDAWRNQQYSEGKFARHKMLTEELWKPYTSSTSMSYRDSSALEASSIAPIVLEFPISCTPIRHFHCVLSIVCGPSTVMPHSCLSKPAPKYLHGKSFAVNLPPHPDPSPFALFSLSTCRHNLRSYIHLYFLLPRPGIKLNPTSSLIRMNRQNVIVFIDLSILHFIERPSLSL